VRRTRFQFNAINDNFPQRKTLIYFDSKNGSNGEFNLQNDWFYFLEHGVVGFSESRNIEQCISNDFEFHLSVWGFVDQFSCIRGISMTRML